MMSRVTGSLKNLGANVAGKVRDVHVQKALSALGGGTEKLTNKAMAPDSVTRVLLHRSLPNLDRILSKTSITGPLDDASAGSHAAKVLAGLALSSAKGSRTAARGALKDSLASRAGMWEGAVLGNTAGSLTGGLAGWNAEGDVEGKAKRVLLGTLLGGMAGTGLGGAGGLYGTAGFRGARAGLNHFGRRMKGWDELASMGVTPAIFDNHDVMSSAAGKLFGSTTLGDLKQNWRGMRDVLGNIVDQGDKGKVQMMTDGAHGAGTIFNGPFGAAARNAGLRELDAGIIANPDVAQAALAPHIWAKMQRDAPMLERFYGVTAGNTTRYLGNPKAEGPEGAKSRLLAEVVRRTLAQSNGATPRFVPRQTTGSLAKDLWNRKQQAPRDIESVRATVDGKEQFIQSLPKSLLKRLELDKDDVRKVVMRASDEGNVNVKRVWEDAYKNPDADRRFSVDLRRDLLPQIAENPVLKSIQSNPKATWRDKLLGEDSAFHADGVREWKPSFNTKQQRAIDEIQRRLQRGEDVRVTDETARALGVSKDDLKEMFVKPKKPVSTVVENPEVLPSEPKTLPDTPKVLPSEPKTLPDTPKVLPSESTAGFKKGPVWDMIVEELQAGKDPKTLLPAWDNVESVLGLSKADLLEHAGVSNADEWERFKRLMVQAAEQSPVDPGIAKAAGQGLSLRVRLALKMALRAA